jgi:hypothetical protein
VFASLSERAQELSKQQPVRNKLGGSIVNTKHRACPMLNTVSALFAGGIVSKCIDSSSPSDAQSYRIVQQVGVEALMDGAAEGGRVVPGGGADDPVQGERSETK